MLPTRSFSLIIISAIIQLISFPSTKSIRGEDGFRVGAAVIDVSPVKFPVAVNGGMTANTANQVNSPLNARAIVLSLEEQTIAMVVVDSCMMPKQLLDEAKTLAAKRTGIPADRIMISATHTHTAAASMSCLGTDADPEYVSLLRLKIVDAISQAQSKLQTAEVGWGSFDAANYMAIRRWIRRPDRIAIDPFGNPTVRANMHAGKNWDDVTGESGPEDPEFSIIAFRTPEGRPIALLANLSMHYFSGVQPISSDYFGKFCGQLQNKLATDIRAENEEPVVVMSHGCSGDVWRMDYTKQTPARFETITIDEYAGELAEQALREYQKIQFSAPTVLDMVEQRLNLNYRTPNKQLLAWSNDIVEKLNGELPKTIEEVYAREQIYLHEAQSTEIVLQAIRIGDLAIATTPTETYALTGLKLKLQSPAKHTMVLDLANGGDGYIPPPEQHVLGGYNTWPARSAGLEIQAEPKIVDTLLESLELIFEQSRQPFAEPIGPEAERLLSKRPLAYFRLDDLSGPRARDASGNSRDAIYESGIVFFLEGPRADLFTGSQTPNRCAHFAGGRMRVRLSQFPENYDISLWIWNGMPDESRDISGWFLSRGNDGSLPVGCEQLGISGVGSNAGKLLLQVGNEGVVSGVTKLARWTWHSVRLSRRGTSLRIFLDDSKSPEIVVNDQPSPPHWANQLFFGGSCKNLANWEGRLDEIAVFADTEDGN